MTNSTTDTRVQTIPLSDDQFTIRQAYLLCLFALLKHRERAMTAAEYSTLLMLMKQLEFNTEEQQVISQYLIGKQTVVDFTHYLTELRTHTTTERFEEIEISLMTSAIQLFNANELKYEVERYQQWVEVVTLQEALSLNALTIELIELCLVNYFHVLTDPTLTRQKVKTLFSDLNARSIAACLPVRKPFAAICLAGLPGVSAAALSHGLTALGLNNLPGYVSTLTDSHEVTMISLGSYKFSLSGLNYTSGRDTGHFQLREFFLQHYVNTVRETLVRMMGQVTGLVGTAGSTITPCLTLTAEAAALLGQRMAQAEHELYINRLPDPLDIDRLNALTTDSRQQTLSNLILPRYTLETVKAPDGSSVPQYLLQKTLSNDELHILEKALVTIGYFDLKNVAVHKAKKATASASDKISRFFSSKK